MMYDRGRQLTRYYGDRRTTLQIVQDLISLRSKIVLENQRELLDEKFNLEDIAA